MFGSIVVGLVWWTLLWSVFHSALDWLPAGLTISWKAGALGAAALMLFRHDRYLRRAAREDVVGCFVSRAFEAHELTEKLA